MNIQFLNCAVKPTVLCIGDSVTDAFLAGGYPYHTKAKLLSMMDDIDFSGGGSGDYSFLMLGTKSYDASYTYKSTALSVRCRAEGRGGWTMYSYMMHATQRDPNQATWDLLGLGNGSHTDYIDNFAQKDLIASTPEINVTEPPANPFFDTSKTGGSRFSLTKYLDRYRTMSADGVRLSVGTGTGTQITPGNVGTYDICTPTHVFIMLGHNDFGRCSVNKFFQNAMQILSDIRAQLPYSDIALAVTLPLIGSYHPDLYPDYDGVPAPHGGYWYDNAKVWNDAYSSLPLDTRQFIIPVYYTLPTAESFSTMGYSSPGGNILKKPFPQGAGGTYHPGIDGHASIATQLHAWVKYTQTYNPPTLQS
jgi:hypothetical protein